MHAKQRNGAGVTFNRPPGLVSQVVLERESLKIVELAGHLSKSLKPEKYMENNAFGKVFFREANKT